MTLRPAAFFPALIFLSCSLSLAAAQETAPEPIQVSGDVMRGVLMKKVAPVYPPLARQARIQGTVILKVVIDKSGNVFEVDLVSGHPMLSPAAMDAVRQWKYQPYLVNGEPVDVETNVQVIFRLDDQPAPSNIGPPGAMDGRTFVGPQGGGLAGGFAAGRVVVPEAVMRDLRTANVTPTYAPSALASRVQGSVILSLQISRSGEVTNVIRVASHPMLVQAAIEAAKQWKYEPYRVNGEPVDVVTTAQIDFILSSDQDSEGSVRDAPLNLSPSGSESIAGSSAPAPPSGTTAPALPKRVRTSPGVSQALLISKVNPVYPPDAREQHIQGVVRLKVNIDTEGNVSTLELISGHPLLAPAAIDAVKQWKYRPYLLNGEPIEVETEVQVNFVLTETLGPSL